MLKRLSISNYLLIDRLELDLSGGFTAITGETGSGKSILIGALGLAMGDRADAGMARDTSQRCVIELEVDVKGLGLATWCETAGVPYEEPFILRRQVDPATAGGPGGRSRAFVNDTPVRLEQLRELGERLVHVHSQHHTLLLHDPRFQLGLVDHAAGHAKVVAAYRKDHNAWRAVAEELRRVREEEERSRAEQDYLRFQLDELDQAALREGEQEELEQALQRAEHAGEIRQGLEATEMVINGDRGMVGGLAVLRQQLARMARHDATVQELHDRLNTVSIELKDVAEEAARRAAGMQLDPREAERMRERLDVIIRLQQKHRVKDAAALLELITSLRERTHHMATLSDRIAALEAQEAVMRQHVVAEADRISAARQKAMPGLALEVEVMLKKLGMPHNRFLFDHRTAEPGPDGMDAVRALFSANKDRAPEPLDKVASGGELSRVMLALIGLSAESLGLPTVVFDEIDTGVSGEVADRVGELLRQMAQRRQVIAITHLPQIASKAKAHLLVSKNAEADRVRTAIDTLDSERRVQAIARMLSGRRTTAAALEQARELLKGA
ncbi:MAG: DNA repair protein RecN [Flavobacteriales bacterium]|nr:DNA repair protein RecN [Flavobacteriales bacterium]